MMPSRKAYDEKGGHDGSGDRGISGRSYRSFQDDRWIEGWYTYGQYQPLIQAAFQNSVYHAFGHGECIHVV